MRSGKGFYAFILKIYVKKMVSRAASMVQAGQYNFSRCERGEAVAAELALSEFIGKAIFMIYLLNRCYTPFYKWMHRGLRELASQRHETIEVSL